MKIDIDELSPVQRKVRVELPAETVIGEAEICAIDPEGLSFVKLNSPEDYQSGVRRWQGV